MVEIDTQHFGAESIAKETHHPKRILLIEDDLRLAELISQYFSKNGFIVVTAHSGERGLSLFEASNPDLLILDIMLPGIDGLTLCRQLRQSNSNVPILMLTAKNEDVDQILGFEFGADDYVIKPVEPRVLSARCHALLRRKNHRQSEGVKDISIGKLHISVASRRVTFNDEVIAISSNEFDLLLFLAQHAGNVLSRDFLFQKLCHREYDGFDRTIDVRISQLRKKLGDSSSEPFRLKTVWGKGYLFVQDAWD